MGRRCEWGRTGGESVCLYLIKSGWKWIKGIREKDERRIQESV